MGAHPFSIFWSVPVCFVSAQCEARVSCLEYAYVQGLQCTQVGSKTTGRGRMKGADTHCTSVLVRAGRPHPGIGSRHFNTEARLARCGSSATFPVCLADRRVICRPSSVYWHSLRSSRAVLYCIVSVVDAGLSMFRDVHITVKSTWGRLFRWCTGHRLDIPGPPGHRRRRAKKKHKKTIAPLRDHIKAHTNSSF